MATMNYDVTSPIVATSNYDVTSGENETTTIGLPLTPDYSLQDNFRYFGICVATFAIIVGGVGNLFTILAFFTNKKLQTSFNVFIVNLSIVDFITATLMLPFNLAGYVQKGWPFGNDHFTSRLQAFSYFSCGYSSVVFLVAITVNRFVGVVSPAKYGVLFSRNRIIIALLFCWTFAPICMFPFLVGTNVDCNTPKHALTGFARSQLLSTFICLKGWALPYMQVTRVLFQFIPLAIMIALYSYIFFVIHNKRKQMYKTMTRSRTSSSATLTNNLTVAVAAPSADPTERRRSSAASKAGMMVRKQSCQDMANAKRVRANNRMLLIAVVICIGFMITFLPSVIVYLPGISQHVGVRGKMLASNLSWFNASLNPLIYVVLNRRFRKEYARLLKLIFGGARSGWVHESSTYSRGQRSVRRESNSVANHNHVRPPTEV